MKYVNKPFRKIKLEASYQRRVFAMLVSAPIQPATWFIPI